MEGSNETRQGSTGQESHRKRQRTSADQSFHKEQEAEDKNEDLKHQTAHMKHRMPKGYRMMEHMGYRAGDTLGSQETNGYNTTRLNTPIEPLSNQIETPYDRETELLSSAAAEEEWRRWASNRQDEKRKTNLWRHMQKLAFEMTGDADLCVPNSDPRDFNVLWRPYVKELVEGNKQEPLVEEPETDEEVAVDHKQNYDESVPAETLESGREAQPSTVDIESCSSQSDEGADEELKALYGMDIDDRIMKLHIFLRCELYYCYYCGVQFEGERELQCNCPGLTEAEHE